MSDHTSAPESRPDSPPASPASRATIGVLGLGHLGSVLARNLVASGYPTIVYDRNEAKRQACVGAQSASSIAGLAGCELVLSSLPNDEAVTAVSEGPDGLLANLKRGAIHVSTSTISPGLSRRLAVLHQDHGQGYVASAILGNPDLAAARKVFLLVAGEQPWLDRAVPVIATLGQRVFQLGADAGHAHLLKLAANALTATTLESMGEVLALLRSGGISAELGFEVLTQSLFDAKVHLTYGGKIVRQQYRPAGMVVPLALKDMRLALSEAHQEGVPMPSVELVQQRLQLMLERGWEGLDWSALGLLSSQQAGLPASAELADVVGPAV